MPALNHADAVHAAKVESGDKTCSIRGRRKRPFKVGDVIYHVACNYRKGVPARKLGTAICKSVTPIVIDGNRVLLGDDDLAHEEIVTLARQDGFATGAEFLAYFNRNGRFEGDLITW